MKGDFTRFSHDPNKHYTRVLKQQGRVDLDADWNEALEIFHQLERTEARDVIGRCGVPEHSNGYKIEPNADGSGLTISRGRIYVDGILCTNEADPDDPDADQPIPITDQSEELPGYPLPDADGVYLAYVDVWERHITCVEDPEIREVALGGPDTATRTRTQCQVRLEPLGEDGPLENFECRSFTGIANTGRLAAQSEPDDTSTNPCVVPASAGYRGLENRLYRVEIHDDGRDAAGLPSRTPTFKWSRDNGAVVLPIADDGIDGEEVTVKRLGRDDVLTVKVGDWVEVSGDTTELYGRHGTLAQIQPDGIDRANLEITLSEDVSAHEGERHPKLRRWDHHTTDEVALQDGALPIQGDWFELEDGVQIRFDDSATYHVGDYWVIPARTREGTVLWPKDGVDPVERRRLGIEHHYCTLALVRRVDNVWTEVRDCRNLFPPLTEIGDGCCCVRVMPGEDIQQAIDTVIGAGGGCVSLCAGVHEVNGPLQLIDGVDVRLIGQGAATVVRFHANEDAEGGLVIENGRRVAVEHLFFTSEAVPSLVTIRHDDQWNLNRSIALRGLTLVNTGTSTTSELSCGIRLSHTEGTVIQDCRIAAEAGIVSLWGNALPDITGDSEHDGRVAVSFEQPQVGTEYRVGDSLTEGDIAVTGEAFTVNGQTISDGVARIDDQGRAGGSGQDIQTSNLNLNFKLPSAYTAARLNFGYYGGAVNLLVNGQPLYVGSVFALNGQTVGGVAVSVTFRPGSQQIGTLTFTRGTQPIRTLSIGGQEFWIDEVEFRDPITALDLTYGDGVRGLVLEDTTIRFRDFGVLSAVSDRWTLRRGDIRTYDAEVFAQVDKLLADASSRQDYADGLASLELLWNQVGKPTPGSVALTTFLCRDSTVADCTLSGDLGVIAVWWIRGVVRESRITGDDIGLFALWLHDATFSRSRFIATAGTALAFAGCYRTRVDHNDLRGLVGIGDLSFSLSLEGLRFVLYGLLRGYGGTGLSGFVLFWVMVEQSVDLMALRELTDALQDAIAEELNDIPVTMLIAYLLMLLLDSLTDLSEDGASLAVIDLLISHNQLTCDTCAVSLSNFLPLGSLRIINNRINAVAGQAVHMDAARLFKNPYLNVFLFRQIFVYLLEQVQPESDSELAKVWRDLLLRWQAACEGFLDLDLHVGENTIRSLSTAIESNLFELAITRNHITIRERPAASTDENATVFGRVTDKSGNALSGAMVNVAGTSRTVRTLRDGRYAVTGVSPGKHTLLAVRIGYYGVRQQVSVGAGEQMELNFTLEPAQYWFDDFTNHGRSRFNLGNIVRVDAPPVSVARNPEIAEVIDALEASQAFQPLAAALREGGYTEPRRYSEYLLSEDGPLSNVQQREEAAKAISSVRGVTSDDELIDTCDALNAALRETAPTAALWNLVPRLIRGLQRYVDSQGILIKGVGCRIVENHIVVPADVQADTQAFGGIQVSVDLADLVILVLAAQYIQEQVLQRPNEQAVTLDPLLGVTETLIDNNEVIGGMGHGISLQGAPGRPDFLQDLRIRANEIRGMAGTAIYCNENAIVIGMNLEGNQIAQCGRRPGFTHIKGGIVVRSAAVCHIHGNRVIRCGEGVSQTTVCGVDLESVYALNFTDNELLANGSEQGLLDDGGLRLQDVYGSTSLHDNVFAYNRGTGMTWTNSAQPGEQVSLPPWLITGLNLNLRINASADDLVHEEQASVQNNVFKKTGNAGFPVFKILNLADVNFSGNTCHVQTTYGSSGEIENTTRLVVANNVMQTNARLAIAIRKVNAGVILGNNGNVPIEVNLASQVEAGYNVPPVQII